jgi:hypothetical protein
VFQIFVQGNAGSAVAGAGRTIRNLEHGYLTSGTTGNWRTISARNVTRRATPGETTWTRQIFTIRLPLKHPSRYRLINGLSTPVWITEIRAWHTSHPAHVLVI